MRIRFSFGAWLGLSVLAHAATYIAVSRARASDGLDGAAEQVAAATTLTGDTLEVPGLDRHGAEESSIDLDLEPTRNERAPAQAQATLDPEGAERAVPPRSRPRSKVVVHGAPAHASAAAPAERSGDAEPARFGAVGERGSVDLATAFTRGFPQAASADPVWLKAPFGSAGALDVILSLDDTGHLVEARLEAGGTPALRQAIARTIALVRGRTFTARRGTTRLHVVGVVTADAVRNEARGGDVFAIGGSYVKNSGSAFFSLAIGRRIDVTITER